MKTNHTPTPYKVARLFRENMPEAFAVTTGKWGAPLVAICDRDEDAIFIAKSCNSHAALVATLEDMLSADNAICENLGRKSDQAMQRIAAIDQARAALALAKQ